jgi:hypothetical protein
MHVWRDELESGIPFEGDCFFIGGAGFVIQDLQINGVTPGCQTHHNGVIRQWWLLLDLKACWRMRLPLAWKAIMMYWLPEHALMGKRPVSSVKSLLSGFVMTKTWLEGASMGGGIPARGAKEVGLGFVDRTFWRCWARWPMIVSLASGQYLAAFEYVRPSKVLQLPSLIASSQVCLTGKPRQAC